MALAIFDLDNTILCDDSDHLWGAFLVELGVVDGKHYKQENDRFYQEYREGRLDIFEFLRFSLKPLSEYDPETLYAWREQFMADKIDPIILPVNVAPKQPGNVMEAIRQLSVVNDPPPHFILGPKSDR